MAARFNNSNDVDSAAAERSSKETAGGDDDDDVEKAPLPKSSHNDAILSCDDDMCE